MNCKISVIIPVYNCGRYLRCALDSVIVQTYKNIEIIIVNDGSTDDSQQICAEYEKKYENIKCYYQSNKGVTAARKYGIENASGDYIAFMDADDWMDDDFFERLISEIGDADVIASGCKKQYMSGNMMNEYNGCKAGKYDTKDKLRRLYGEMLIIKEPYMFGILPYLWNKLFKRDVVINYVKEIDENINDGEDVGILIPTMLKAEKIILSDYCGYNYRIHEAQACAQKRADSYFSASHLYLWIYNNITSSEYKEELMPQLNQYMRLMIWKFNPLALYKFNEFFFPFKSVKEGSDIVLYGSGNVGCVYYQQIKDTGFCNIRAWADKRHSNKYDKKRGIIMITPDKVIEYPVDYVVIAINDISIVRSVKASLLEMGIEEKKIVYAESHKDGISEVERNEKKI